MPLDTGRIARIGVLGWMREFEADVALGEIAFYAEAGRTRPGYLS